jgi:hypothetical protein
MAPAGYPGIIGPVTRPVSAPAPGIITAAAITATAWPKPFIFRGPAPRRALAGSSLLCGTGVAVLAVSLGVPVTKSFRYSAGGAW